MTKTTWNIYLYRLKVVELMEKIKRNQVTYSRRILDPIRRLNDSDRLTVYDALNDYFLDGKPLQYDSYSYTVQTILACIAPEMRLLETKYLNRKNAKKSVSLLNCKKIDDENVPDVSQKSDTIKIPYNKYNTDNKYNFLYKQTTARAHAYASENLNKTINDGDELVARIEKIAALDPATAQRTLTLVEQLQSDAETIRISGKPTRRAEILHAYNKMLGRADALERLQYVYHEADIAPGVHNPYRYTVALLYNVATDAPKPEYNKATVEEIERHKYSSEELNALFDNLDDIGI